MSRIRPIRLAAPEYLANMARWKKRAVMLTLDAILFVFSMWFALYLRLGVLTIEPARLVPFLVVGALTVFPILWLCGVYQAIFRFVGAGMIGALLRAYLIYGALMLLIFGFIGVAGVPRTTSVIQPMIFFTLIIGARTVAGFALLELLGQPIDVARVRIAMVYGAGEIGQQLLRSLKSEREIRIAGYLDDDPRLAGQRLDGYRIYNAADFERVQRDTGVEIVLLAMPTLGRVQRRAIVDRLSQHPVEVLALPRMGEIVDGSVSFNDVRPLELDDLLGRESVAPNEVLLSKTIFGKTVLVTGAGGSIGSELCRQIARLRPKCVVLVEMTEHSLYLIEREMSEFCAGAGISAAIVTELVNVVDTPSVIRLFERWKPDTVFHAAAYKHVPIVEANPVGGLRNNIIGTLNCAEAARDNGVAHFILISTDKAVRPTNAMGASKRVCEMILQGMASEAGRTRFAMVRFGNVLGSSGSVVPRFLSQIRQGGPVTLTHRDITRFFMTIPEAAQLVIQAGAMAEGGEVYLLDMGEPVRIYDLAVSMIRLSGLTLRDEGNPDGDIEVVEVGLRSGEKLFEELLIDAKSIPTKHPRIMTAREGMIPIDELRAKIATMRAAFAVGDAVAAVHILSDLVPGYTSQIADRTSLRLG